MEYPLYKNNYKLTQNKFYALVKNFTPQFITVIPQQMKFKPSIDTYNGKYLLIKENWEKNEELNNITDYFTEEVRIKCNFKNHISPLEYWNLHGNEIITESMKKFGENNIKFIRDSMYYRVKFCNNFRISVALTMYRLFNAKKILDISAGWGDRLIAAIAHNASFYCGVDPNSELHPHYTDIINTLAKPEDTKNFVLINDGFETATIPKNDYDLVFSSPPFFDLENYSTSEKDSVIAYKNEERWFNDFLVPSIKKAYDNLIVGGHMILYIAESTSTHYIDKMFEYINSIMKYNGSIPYFYTDKFVPRNMYIWKKK